MRAQVLLRCHFSAQLTQELCLFVLLYMPALGAEGVLCIDSKLLSSIRSKPFSCLPLTSLGRLG